MSAAVRRQREQRVSRRQESTMDGCMREKLMAKRVLRDMMMPEAFYQGLDVGIRFAVRVLHAAGGIETCQSCQGGKDHSYDRPTVDMIAGGDDALGFRALAALRDYGLPIRDLQIVWNICHGLPYEKLWRVTFSKTMEDRADDKPMFIHGYFAQ